MKTTVELDDEDMDSLSDAMWTIFMILPEKHKDRFVEMIMETYELGTMDQAREAMAESRYP